MSSLVSSIFHQLQPLLGQFKIWVSADQVLTSFLHKVTVAAAGGFVSPRQFIVVSQVLSNVFVKDNDKGIHNENINVNEKLIQIQKSLVLFGPFINWPTLLAAKSV